MFGGIICSRLGVGIWLTFCFVLGRWLFMRILITNDDGVTAEGLICLADALSVDNEVFVVAPESERSGMGHAITLHVPLWIKEVDMGKKYRIFATTGTPADSVKLGYDVIMDKRVDLILSGVNRGPNLGTDLIYSGTVSGALEGAMLGIPSIAVSTASWSEPNFESATRFVVEFIRNFDLSVIPEFTALNVNVPALPYDEIKGWRITRQSKRRYKDYFEARKDPFGNTYYWMLGHVIEDDPDEESDYVVVKKGYVSITPISAFLTDWRIFEKLKEVLESVQNKVVRRSNT